MIAEHYRALVAHKKEDGSAFCQVKTLSVADLPPGDLLIEVAWSSLNYKDALSARGVRGVTRHYPHTPGVDAAGRIVHSDHPGWHKGQEVLVTGFDLGMNTPGGFGRYIRVPAEWALPIPQGLDLRTCMMLGTAGLTAGLCLDQLMNAGLTPASGPLLISGATGGVGSIALMLAKQQGYTVTVFNGLREASAYLRHLGADTILPRQASIDASDRALVKSQWAGAIDTVGGEVLASTLKAVQPGGVVACCGNAAGNELKTTVLPFILNRLRLIGIGSASTPLPARQNIWQRFASDWRLPELEHIIHTVDLDHMVQAINDLFSRARPGRTLLQHTD